jgi:voltage-gated potassium channel
VIPQKRIVVNFTVWSQMMRGRAYRLLRMQTWFPHVPLALVVGLIGLAEFLRTSGSVRRLVAWSARGHSLASSAAQGLDIPGIRGVPHEAIGVLLLIVAAGMLWRSRLAWVLAFLLTLAAVILELSPISKTSAPFTAFSILLLIVLLLFRRSFSRVSLATGTLFALTGVLFALGYGVLGTYVLGAGFNPPIRNVVQAVYFAVVTMATVGYGDVTPRTPETQLFTVSLIILGLAVFATSLTAIVGPLIDSRMAKLLQPKRKRMKRASHIIVIGDGPLARSTIKALAGRGLQNTAIRLARRPDETDPPEDLIVGDGSDSEVLHGADIAQARAVLALSEDDSFNAFVILAAKEMNPSVRTVVAVSNAGNARRMARVHPDVVLALPQIGGELLAMALGGEEVKADALIDQLLRLG